MSSTTRPRKNPKKNASLLRPPHGIPQREMFVLKNMEALLKLKLDMVYRDLPMEEAQKRFDEVAVPAPAPVVKKKLKVIKTILESKK